MSPGKWEEDERGWWKCELWEGLSFKFKDGSEQLQRCSRRDPDGDGDGSTIILQRALQDATSLLLFFGSTTDSWYGSLDLLQILAHVLQEADNPVPDLEQLSFDACGSEAWRPFLNAAMAHKLVRLKSFKVKFVHGSEPIVPYLTDVIGSGKVPDLSALSLRNCELDSDEVKSLAAALKRGGGSFRELRLSGNRIGRGGHLALAELMMSGHLVHLETLNLKSTGMNGDSCAAYVKAIDLGCLQALKALKFVDNNFDLQDHVDLAKVLESGRLSCLETLDLEDTGMDADSCTAYSTALASGHVQALKNLNFSSNQIGLKGHMALATALKSGQLLCLEKLSLQGTHMYAACCKAYSTVLASGRVPAMKYLEFGGNEIAADGVKALCGAVASRKVNITHVILNWNEIGDKGMKAMVDCMKAGHLPDLVYLDLANNPFSEAGYSMLGSALASGAANSLRYLLIDGNVVKRETILHILEAFSQNKLFVAEVYLKWWDYPDLELQMQEFRNRNLKQVQIRKDLGGPDISEVAATRGKVYLCGNPMAGKTTLRKSMQRSLGRALCMRERRSTSEKRTRGIDVSQLKSPGKDGLSLAVWDMAGQEEYHLVHHVFLRDPSSLGSATSFIIVCRSEQGPITIKNDLEYWLRFIASSSNREMGNPREVFVVLNRIDGVMVDTSWWKGHLEDMKGKYKELLTVREEVYMVDLRKRSFVLGLKKSVIELSREILCDQKVPKICQMLQDRLILWIKQREEFPVLHWITFFEKVKKVDPSCPENMVKAATKYLHEAGIVIYISNESLVDLHIKHTGNGLVILEPNWLCREVVGTLILPEEMRSESELCLRNEVDENNGSIPIAELCKFFRSKHKEWTASNLEDLKAILLRLGLCFQGAEERLFIPCLIKEDDQSRGECWDAKDLKSRHEEGEWVMGYTVEYDKNDITVLAPIALWHNFQVELAQIDDYKNPSFKVGKSFVSFRYKGMAVLIEVMLGNVDNPTFDSIDIFVKPLDKVANTTRRAQLDLAHDLTNRLLKLWNRVCPAVRSVQRVVWPWPALQPRSKIRSLEVRNFLQDKSSQISEVRRRVQERGVGEELDLRVGSFEIITYDDLLSSELLGDAAKSLQNQVTSVQNQVKSLGNQVEEGLRVWNAGIEEAIKEGLYPLDFLKQVRIDKDEASSSTSQDLVGTPRFKSIGPDQLACNSMGPSLQNAFKGIHSRLDGIEQTAKEILNQGKEILKGVSDVHSLLQNAYTELKDVKVKQELLLDKVQDFQSIFLEDKELSCPRFIYLVTKDAGRAARWTSLKSAIALSVKVHVRFVCEAQYDIHGQHGLHQVVKQQGIDVSTMKEWAKKLAPWLKVSLTVLSITAKVAANVVAPGVGSILPNAGDIFPDFMQMNGSGLADLLISGIGYSQEELDQLMNKGKEPSSNSTLENPQQLCRNTRDYMTEELKKLSVKDFQEKVALRKVSLQHKGKSDAASVLWICDECYKEYDESENTTIHELNRSGNR